MIPLYIIEEHHEAFYIWNKATQEGILPPFGNTLLHVDHHPDFESGAYGTDFCELFSTLADMHTLTYKNLGIADFICPAIYQGIFNDVVLLQNYTPFLSKPEDKIIRLDTECVLVVEAPTLFTRSALLNPEAQHRLFTYRTGGLGMFHTPQTLVLDIDIDYFCWDDSLSGVADKRLEITGQAYREVTENPYHPFRLFPRAWLQPEEENGRYYLRYRGLPNPVPIPEKERIQKRINLFINWLKQNEVSPCMISLCRSRYSGYTPGSVWKELETTLLTSLAEVYDYDLQS